ncbi:MAG: hypothetical protein IPN19_01060 [Elusimicrobia bacterium]|nr:hypothetical protein [Elusimicrobiota bacterium]
MFFLTALFWSSNVFASSAQTENIPPREYYATVQRELAKAKKSITVCMYLFTFRPNQSTSQVFHLAQSLKKAHDAGVRVEVILDQNINFVEGDERASDLSEGKNAPAYTFLKAQGIPVYYDDASTYTHSKAVVIDEETVIAGSTNWSESALARNQEINFLIRSKDVARDVLATLQAIPRQNPMPNAELSMVDLSGEFLEDTSLLARMTAQNDERAFDTYLYLVKQSSPSFSLNDEELAQSLGLPQDDRHAYRKQINKVLKKLQRRYGLIEVQTAFSQEAEIFLNVLPNERSAKLPRAYWILGWNRRLSFAGKTVFLISQYESEVSTRRPRWSAARNTISRRYGVSPGFISQGVTELRRKNLLEVDYARFASNAAKPRRPTIYTPNPLYNPADLDQKLEELKSKYGPEKVARAQTAAAAVYEDCDVHGIKELIDLETEFGQAKVDAAVKLLAQKNPDNPARTLGYLIGTIRNLK